jgi:hypothetical protein
MLRLVPDLPRLDATPGRRDNRVLALLLIGPDGIDPSEWSSDGHSDGEPCDICDRAIPPEGCVACGDEAA